MGRRPPRSGKDPIRRKLPDERVPVCSVVFGGKMPPRDAAIVSIEPPETVYAGDKLNVKVQLKLDGLAGQKVRLGLYDGKDRIAEEIVTVPNDRDRMRTKRELSAEPKEPGQHNYQVRLEGPDGQAIEGEAFAAEGMSLVLADVEEEPLAAAAAELSGKGAKVVGVPCDVARPADMQALAERTLSEFGAVHILSNNAGVGGAAVGQALWERSLEELRVEYGLR